MLPRAARRAPRPGGRARPSRESFTYVVVCERFVRSGREALLEHAARFIRSSSAPSGFRRGRRRDRKRERKRARERRRDRERQHRHPRVVHHRERDREGARERRGQRRREEHGRSVGAGSGARAPWPASLVVARGGGTYGDGASGAIGGAALGVVGAFGAAACALAVGSIGGGALSVSAGGGSVALDDCSREYAAAAPPTHDEPAPAGRARSANRRGARDASCCAPVPAIAAIGGAPNAIGDGAGALGARRRVHRGHRHRHRRRGRAATLRAPSSRGAPARCSAPAAGSPRSPTSARACPRAPPRARGASPSRIAKRSSGRGAIARCTSPAISRGTSGARVHERHHLAALDLHRDDARVFARDRALRPQSIS